MKSAFMLLIALLMVACQKPETESIAGADRDSHSCIGSAGYLWCAKENQCTRPWELAKEKQFENSVQTFKTYCDSI
jgi:hypothetical protein